MANDINELREHLFETLRGLRDKEKPLEIERAKAVAAVAQTIINSAKVEVEHMKLTGGQGSGFIPDALPAPADGAKPAGINGKTVHRLRG